MAILWIDGFNDGTAGIALRYTTTGVTAMANNPLTGRAVALSGTEAISRAVPFGDSTVIVGVAFRADIVPSVGLFDVLAILEGATTHLVLRYDCATRTLRLYRGDGVLLGSGTAVLPAPADDYIAWRYVELKATIAEAGSAALRIADAADITFSGDTRNGASGVPDAVTLGDAAGGGQAFAIDDFYVLDGTGAPADFLGQYTTISALSVQGAGTFSSWTPSAGAAWECVDELDPNGDSDYVESAVRGALDSYATGGFVGAPVRIHAVQINAVARADAAAPLELRSLVMQGGVETPGADHTVGASYASYSDIFERDPATGAAWTAYGIGALQLGIEDGAADFQRFVTSRPYPIAVPDAMSMSIAVVSGEMRSQRIFDSVEALDFGLSVVGGSLSSGLQSTATHEALGVSVAVVSGELRQTLKTVTPPAEEMAVTVAVVTGELRQTLRSYVGGAESMDFTLSVVSGELA